MTGQAARNIEGIKRAALEGLTAEDAAGRLQICISYVKALARQNGLRLAEGPCTGEAGIGRYGCSRDQYNQLRGTVTLRYREQRRNAQRRGIGWELSFWQWWSIWRDSGRWSERGRGQGYVMCRKGDVGPYSVDNVFIATAIENASNSVWRRSSLPRGVFLKNRRHFQAERMYGGKTFYLGIFLTAELAHQAYLSFTPEAAQARIVDGEIIKQNHRFITLPDRPFDWRSPSPADAPEPHREAS